MSDAIDWSYFLSSRALEWKPSAIRGLYPLEKRPGMISLLAGKPNPETFPFSSLSVNVKPVVPSDPVETLTIEGDALSQALQYGATAGLPGLVEFLEDLNEKRHHRARDGSWRVSVGSGSQDLITKAFHALLNEGDSLLIESPVYSGTLGLLTPEKITKIEIPCDTAGLNPDALEDTLTNWEAKYPGKRFPKLLYTIPTGSNPTGCSSPQARKEKVLALARRFNLLILEDDAYHYIHFAPEHQAPSYFELEARNGGTTGRVVRFDSFSKILSSGMRLGFLTAAKELCDKVDLETSNTNLQSSSTTQAIVLVLLQKWGFDGFIAHTHRVAAFYKQKRDMFEAAAHRHLDGLATWVSPDCGMFLFINLDIPGGDSARLISTTAVEKGILGVPGVGFSPSGQVSSFVRVSFSLTDEKEADEGMRRLAACVREARGEK